VEEVLLNDLNSIYVQECIFDQILCKESDGGFWEIFLAERGKGDIRLSQSGSSLKSIFIILAFFNLIPMVQKNFNWNSIIFAFEEPENNLHPSLLRRLLEYLAAKRKQHDFLLFITTHSPIGIDWSSRRSDSQVIHIKSDGEKALATTAVGASKSYDILDDLDIRASDLLQSNCIVWLEGPTDRMYLRRWLELVSDGELIEGIHYTAMFYGGKLLSHLSMLSDGDDSLISLISINRNSAILIDSDRNPKPEAKRKPRLNLNSTKKRILDEVNNVGGFSWVTEGREIENYLSPRLLTSLSGVEFNDPVQYEQIINLKAFDAFKKDKVKMAQKAVDEMTKGDILNVLDLENKLNELSKRIRDWNSIS
jgi:predicted ATP-dependent endonuclease of OLD family